MACAARWPVPRSRLDISAAALWRHTEQARWPSAKDAARQGTAFFHQKDMFCFSITLSTGAGSPVGRQNIPVITKVQQFRPASALSLQAQAALWVHEPAPAYEVCCDCFDLHCFDLHLALQVQAALWEERADPVRQQLKQLQWELRGTHAAVRALEQQVRETCSMQGLHCRGTGQPAQHGCAHSMRSARSSQNADAAAEAPSEPWQHFCLPHMQHANSTFPVCCHMTTAYVSSRGPPATRQMCSCLLC